MGALKRFLRRLRGRVACLVALLLPYGARLRFAAWLAPDAPDAPESFFDRQARAWNRVILALVFCLGFPLAKVLFLVSGRSRLAPPAGSPTFWVPRPDPRQFDRNVREPF